MIDVDRETPTEVSKPAGRPAEKKMPKTKAPETKAMPRAKAPRLDFETDRALKKLEEATEAKKQAVFALFPQSCPTWGEAIPLKMAQEAQTLTHSNFAWTSSKP